MHTIIKNCIVVPMDGASGKEYFPGSVGIADNKIAFVAEDGRGRAEADQFRRKYGGAVIHEIDAGGKVVMPGLVNTHSHVSMTLMRGYAEGVPLMEWLGEHIWPYEGQMRAEDIRLGAELGIAEMLLGGTTTFADMYWHEAEIARTVDGSGIRAVLSPAFTDAKMEEFRSDMGALLEKYGNGVHSRISLMVAPHSAYTCSRENLLYGKEVAQKNGLGIHVHVSETMAELAQIKERTGKTPVGYLDELGLITASTLAVHCIHLDDADIAILKERGTSVSYNPQSNMKLASGIAPVAKMLTVGINVAVGTDGPSSNNDLDMWEEMRSGSLLQKVAAMDSEVMPAYETLRMATVNGAKALGLEGKIGQLKPGMATDIIMLDTNKPHMTPEHDLISNLVYCAKSSDVDTVMVDGRTVVEAGRLLDTDAESLFRHVRRRALEIAGKV